MVRDPLQDQIEEAERQLAIRLKIASRAGASMEDDWNLERARTRLLDAENKKLKAEIRDLKRRLRDAGRKDHGHGRSRSPVSEPQHRLSALERAEQAFSVLTAADKRGSSDPENHQQPRGGSRMGGALCTDADGKPQGRPDERDDRRHKRPLLTLPKLERKTG